MPRLFVWGTAIVLFTLSVLVFSGNGRNEFCRLDDPHYLLSNVHIREGLTPGSVGWSLASVGFESNWHPLTWVSHALDISVGHSLKLGVPSDPSAPIPFSGPFSSFCHSENVVLHGLNVVLLYLVILSLADATHMSVIAAGVFALFWGLHPLRVEVVAWAAERKELLSVLFMLLSMLAYAKPTPCRTFVSLVCFVLALLAKPVAVGLPVVLAAYDLFLAHRTLRGTLVRVLPFAMASAAASVLTLMAQTDALKMGGRFPFLQRLTCAVEAPAVYLAQTVWPKGLSISYAMPEKMGGPFFIAGIVLAILLAVLVWAGLVAVRRDGSDERSWWLRLGLFAVAWTYVCLVPMLGFVKVGYQPHSDRYTYWVGCGVAAVGALAYRRLASVDWRNIADEQWARCWPRIRCGVRVFVGAALVALVAATVVRSRVWRTSRDLFTDAVRKTHLENDAALLVDSLLEDGREGREEAIEMARGVLAERHSPFARSLLSYVLAIGGRSERDMFEARRLAEYALEDPDYGRHLAFAALAFADWQEKNYEGALAWMEQAVSAGYVCPAAWMARLREKTGKKDAE